MYRFIDSRPTSRHGAYVLCFRSATPAALSVVLSGECRSASAAFSHPYEYTSLYEFTRIRNDILSVATLTLQALTISPNPCLNFDETQ